MTITATTLDPLLSSSPSSSPGSAGLVAWYAEGITDAIGDRLHLFDNAGPALELLRIRPELAEHPGFEPALRRRVSELEGLRHPALGRVRSVTVLDDPTPALALVSELAEGERLSSLLVAFEQAGVRPDPTAALWLLHRVLPALAVLHERGPAVAHGLLTPNRVVLSPGGGLLVAECALGSAMATLGLAPFQEWTQFGVAHRADCSGPWMHRTNDIAQAAFLACAVLLGRPLRLAELTSTPALVEEACAAWPTAQRLMPWLRRALGPGGLPFESADEALAALDDTMRGLLEAWPGSLLPASPAPVRRAVPQENSPVSSPPSRKPPEAQPPRFLPAPPSAPVAPRVARWLWVVNAGLVTVALVEVIVLLAQMARGPAAPAASIRQPIEPVQPAVAHATIPPAPAGLLVTVADSTHPTADPGVSKAASPRGPGGWVLVESRVPVKVFANGKLLGTSAHARYHLPAGRSLLTIQNQKQGIAFTEPLDLAAGQTVLLSVDPPR